MANKSNNIKKHLLEALESTMGVVTDACRKAKCNRSTFYEYYNKDPNFKTQVDELQNIALDFAESQLFKNIKKGSDAATIFFLKTKGKKRGYVEKTETEHSGEIKYGLNPDQFKTILEKINT